MFKTTNEDVLHWKSSKSQAIKGSTPIHKKLIILTSIVLLSMFTITSSINSKAEQDIVWNQELLNNPEAILNVQFKDDIHLDNIVDNELTTVKNNQGYLLNQQQYLINGLSALSNIGGTKQMISINGNFSTKNIESQYHSKLKEVTTKIDDIKNNGSVINNLSKENQTILDNQLSKMNSIELKAQRYFNWGEDKLLNLSIIGKTETLTDIKEILVNSGHTKQIVLTEMETVKKQMDDINKQVEGMDEEESQSYIKNIFSETIKSELAKQGITTSIEEYMKQEYQKAPEYQKEVIQNVVEDRDTKSVETSVSNYTKQLVGGTKSFANYEWLDSYKIYPEFNSYYGLLKIKVGSGYKSLLVSGGITTLAWKILSSLQYFCIGMGGLYFQCMAVASFITGGILFNARDWIVNKWCSGGFALNINIYNKNAYYDC